MKTEQSLTIIKPGFLKHKEQIVDMLTKLADVKVVRQKEMKISKTLLAKHYDEHKEKPFYNDLINYMSSDKTLVMVVEGKPGSILKIREVVGSAKDPAVGTIRHKFGVGEVTRNVIHASDSLDSAKREIQIFFNK